jgi:glycine/D-amino acid oxidase-like deaminating enzyme
MVARSLPLWRENERRWNTQLLHPNGALWMAGANDAWEKAAVQELRSAGLAFDVVEAPELQRRYPQMNSAGIRWAIHERDAGFLLARRACQTVVRGFVSEGGQYRELMAQSGPVRSRRMQAVRLSGAEDLTVDRYVFACGPWLGKLFPEEVGDLITPTRQEVLYFGTPAGDARFHQDRFPTWVDNTSDRFYGIPGNEWRGFKIAEDVPGPVFDPTSGDRTPSRAAIDKARRYLAQRFPALKDAPLVESRVCQYEMSADGNLILDRLPQCDNAWVAGGGSGHGFKFGPAVGELMAALVLGKSEVDRQFSLSRFDKTKPPPAPTQRPRT